MIYISFYSIRVWVRVTTLSYIRSPFINSFLDGINVERLSKLITNQSSNAQFIVVSHRRPMISASERTIGVAQARGANTQVVGLPNAA